MPICQAWSPWLKKLLNVHRLPTHHYALVTEEGGERRNDMSDLPKGGSFLLSATDPGSIFTPEDFAEEHRMIAGTVSRFLAEKVFPRMEEVDSKKDGLMRQLLAEAGELGLLGADIPEQYDGMELDKISPLRSR